MSNGHGLDLTRGKPLPLLVRFAIPLILGTIFQQLYSFADTAIVGRCISADALTAVGVTGSLTFMLLGFTTGSAIGFCIPIAQSVGAEEQEEINRYFWNGLYLCLFIGLFVGVGARLFVRDLLIAMRTPTELLDMSVDYLSVILLGLTATVLYNYLGSVLRAFGDAKRPFLFLIFSSILNVLLDFFFILVIPLGVSGVALATVVSQTISVLLCWIWLARKGTALRAEKSLMALSWKHIKTLCCIGIPLGLEHAVCSIGNVVLQRSINTLGSVAATAQICGEKIRGILTTPMESMGMAMATYAGQNYARNCFVESHSDAFANGRTHFAFAAYDLSKPAGQRQTNSIQIYISIPELLELCRKLSRSELRYIMQQKKQTGVSKPIQEWLGGTSAEKLRQYGAKHDRTEKACPEYVSFWRARKQTFCLLLPVALAIEIPRA